MASHSQALAQLIEGARRRQLAQLIAEKAALGIAAAMGGVILLLLAGTQVLDWWWLAVIFGGAFGYGVWRVLQSAPSRYAVAQQIDHTLGLHDAISTAYNFEHSGRRAEAHLVEAQRFQAEAAARTVNLDQVFPFALPKALYGAGAVALVAFGMFALRYGVTHSLDLKPSLVKIAFDTFFKPDTRVAKNEPATLKQKIAEQLQKMGISVNATDAKANELDPNSNAALNANDSNETLNSGDPDAAKSKTISVPNERQSGEPGGDEKSERAAAGDKSDPDQVPEGNDGAPQEGQQAGDPQNAKKGDGNKNSLLDKMRDAMSNLMNKLKMNSDKGDGKQSAQDGKQGSPSEQQGKGDKSQMTGKQQSNGNESQDPQGQQQSQGEQSQAMKGKAGDKKADQQASQDSKSGIGKQDGDKSSQEAEQLAAMGKISEILGKRAKDMSGEVMVEVSAGKQQLKTQYSSSNAAHAESGGEINRDEVPLEYQEYVQHYFEHIRKPPPAGAAAAPAATKK